MSKAQFSSGHAMMLGIMACLVAVLCVTVEVLQADMTSRIIMAAIWSIVAVWWLVQAAIARRSKQGTSNE